VRLPIGSGICPVKLLKPRMSETTAFNWPVYRGISPVNLLLLRSSVVWKAVGMILKWWSCLTLGFRWASVFSDLSIGISIRQALKNVPKGVVFGFSYVIEAIWL
jgi:hypothetical protein